MHVRIKQKAPPPQDQYEQPAHTKFTDHRGQQSFSTWGKQYIAFTVFYYYNYYSLDFKYYFFQLYTYFSTTYSFKIYIYIFLIFPFIVFYFIFVYIWVYLSLIFWDMVALNKQTKIHPRSSLLFYCFTSWVFLTLFAFCFLLHFFFYCSVIFVYSLIFFYSFLNIMTRWRYSPQKKEQKVVLTARDLIKNRYK